jgi:hypothetical protein
LMCSTSRPGLIQLHRRGAGGGKASTRFTRSAGSSARPTVSQQTGRIAARSRHSGAIGSRCGAAACHAAEASGIAAMARSPPARVSHACRSCPSARWNAAAAPTRDPVVFVPDDHGATTHGAVGGTSGWRKRGHQRCSRIIRLRSAVIGRHPPTPCGGCRRGAGTHFHRVSTGRWWGFDRRSVAGAPPP